VPLWILSLAVIKAISDTEVDIAIRLFLHDNVPGYWRLESAQRFPTDYVIGMCVVANILAFKGFSSYLGAALDWIKQPANYLAGYTFSIYLFHRPFTTALGHFFPNVDENHALSIVYLVAVVACCMLLGSITEHRRERLARPLRRLFGVRRECRSGAV
jgi:peptidoglycan/LPS O-acetylase OafA/YrhL